MNRQTISNSRESTFHRTTRDILRWRLSVICVLICLTSQMGAARAEQAFSLPPFPDSPLTTAQEITEAKIIHQECTRILALIPRLSPAENTWLEGEIQAQRDLENLMRRPEYMRHALLIFFADCDNQTEMVIEAPSQRKRAAAWAKLASRFSSAVDLNYWGEHVGIPELQESVTRFAAWSRLYTYQIIDGTVIPYLEGNTRISPR
jgi:hypothetical protein